MEYLELDKLGFPGYRVGDDGSVWSYKCKGGTRTWRWKQLKPWTARGYRVIGLNVEGKRHYRYIHRLVLEAFVGPCPDEMEGCHCNHNPNDNKLKNLRWDTPKNNCQDRTKNGKHIEVTPKGGKHGRSKLTELEVKQIRDLFESGKYSRKELSKKYETSYRNTCDIINKKIWRHI